MVRGWVMAEFAFGGSPHVRGDGPITMPVGPNERKFSPRAWGWSGLTVVAFDTPLVLPTCVGMVRRPLSHEKWPGRSPHVRGDGPNPVPTALSATAFSPRAWGWSASASTPALRAPVLPTCVGMVRERPPWPSNMRRSPHVRGDGPTYWLADGIGGHHTQLLGDWDRGSGTPRSTFRRSFGAGFLPSQDPAQVLFERRIGGHHTQLLGDWDRGSGTPRSTFRRSFGAGFLPSQDPAQVLFERRQKFLP